jgi:hypothetical protein
MMPQERRRLERFINLLSLMNQELRRCR